MSFTGNISRKFFKDILEELYAEYNRREFVPPDPLQFLYGYDDLCDREIAALIASSLAYGRVVQIQRSVSCVLEQMPSPSVFLKEASPRLLRCMFHDFKHRFTSGKELSSMLLGIKNVIERYGSLYACFRAGLKEGDGTVIPALSTFVRELNAPEDGWCNFFLPSPMKGSACKRLHLFLRWMVRCDEVDPGGWADVPASKLIVPLDTHMHRICFMLGLTNRRQADMRTAVDITTAFRAISPDDPVRYDFVLTRLGIRKKLDLNAFLKKCAVPEAAVIA
ncbi:MAG: TIGR02757 family protein [Deltaproteobacteria bacterium]|nr:TIGR02757 family protein [Deltaproteobacteria bacterium]